MAESVELDSEVLTLEQVAEYLKVSPKTIQRMLKSNEIPATKIGGQWRFLREAFMAWLDEIALNASEDSLVKVITSAETVIPITRIIGPEVIVMNMKPGSKRDMLLPLAQILANSEKGLDVNEYTDLLLQREEMVSTGIAPGVAFPHLRNPDKSPVEHPRIIMGICPEGTDFDSLDGEPTYVFAMCCSSSEVVHLRLLAKLALLFKDPQVVTKLRSAKTTKDVMSLLVKVDCKIAASF